MTRTNPTDLAREYELTVTKTIQDRTDIGLHLLSVNKAGCNTGPILIKLLGRWYIVNINLIQDFTLEFRDGFGDYELLETNIVKLSDVQELALTNESTLVRESK